jgi:hypothetical protein
MANLKRKPDYSGFYRKYGFDALFCYASELIVG